MSDLTYEYPAEVVMQRARENRAMHDENARLRTLLREVLEEYEGMLQSTVARVGVDGLAPEDVDVEALCQQWGYGAVISRAAYLWQCRDPVGAFVAGPCLGTVMATRLRIRRALKAKAPSAD